MEVNILEKNSAFLENFVNPLPNYCCPYCKKRFKSESSCNQHVQHKHFDSPFQSSLKLICGTCQKKFQTRQALKQHLKMKQHAIAQFDLFPKKLV